MAERESLIRAALRVLSSYVCWKAPDPEDLRTIREAEPGAPSEWAGDDLAVYIVRKQCASEDFTPAVPSKKSGTRC